MSKRSNTTPTYHQNKHSNKQLIQTYNSKTTKQYYNVIEKEMNINYWSSNEKRNYLQESNHSCGERQRALN